MGSGLFFFFNDTATTEIYTLSLHDALPISRFQEAAPGAAAMEPLMVASRCSRRSEEHTSELQSRLHLVCRLLLEKKKKRQTLPPRRPSAKSGAWKRIVIVSHISGRCGSRSR